MGKFKDSMNRWVSVGLFAETAGPNKDFVIMTLDEAREKFVALGDVTGLLFARTYLGGYAHWKALLASPQLADHIADWIEELEVQKMCEGLKAIDRVASEGHFQANKFLSDRGWARKGAGRPTKAEKEAHLRREQKVRESVDHFLKPVEK